MDKGICARVCALLLALLSFCTHALDDGILPPLMRVGEVSQSQYAVAWWQWQKSVPGPASPFSDMTGLRCDYSQSGPVWFLASAPNDHKVERYCNVPAGKYLFVPVMSQLAAPNYENEFECPAVQQAVAIKWPQVKTLSLELDGHDLGSLAAFRQKARSCFDLLGSVSRDRLPPKIYPSATEGYWVMLRPLSPGEHSLKIRSRYLADSGQELVQDIDYTINIY
ncbi:hypothetical protein [Gallaecimonas xiamenensis]|uniref:Signal peptide protein n=1 Tax=Gallaecimonas xiamenensis 3-C-1 TaxID=745411 RepID=K2J136_9GAMM|nr:hypothetical protein [Gallaecimonas xiamenensis]EKE76621.1 signal peptide protein [Gallaecimonas xiamenensis 3-C-1]